MASNASCRPLNINIPDVSRKDFSLACHDMIGQACLLPQPNPFPRFLATRSLGELIGNQIRLRL